MSNLSVLFVTDRLLKGYRKVTQRPELVVRKYGESNKRIDAKREFWSDLPIGFGFQKAPADFPNYLYRFRIKENIF